MANASMGLPADLEQYLVKHGVREPEILARLRDETALIPQHNMQIARSRARCSRSSSS